MSIVKKQQLCCGGFTASFGSEKDPLSVSVNQSVRKEGLLLLFLNQAPFVCCLVLIQRIKEWSASMSIKQDKYPEDYGLHEKYVKYDACANVRYQTLFSSPPRY